MSLYFVVFLDICVFESECVEIKSTLLALNCLFCNHFASILFYDLLLSKKASLWSFHFQTRTFFVINISLLNAKNVTNSFELQKFNSSVGTLPQLEPQVVQVVVSNAKNQHQQSDNILPQIANKGGQNNYQTQSVRLSCSSHLWYSLVYSNEDEPCISQNAKRLCSVISCYLTGWEAKAHSAVRHAVWYNSGQSVSVSQQQDFHQQAGERESIWGSKVTHVTHRYVGMSQNTTQLNHKGMEMLHYKYIVGVPTQICN